MVFLSGLRGLCVPGAASGRKSRQRGKIPAMRSFFLAAALVCGALAVPAFVLSKSAPGDQVSRRAQQLHDRAIVVDTHDDTTQRLVFDKTFDIAARNKNGNIDVPRMKEGGLDALFFSIWVPSDVTGPPAVKRALDQIDAVREAVRTMPKDLMLATTAADVRKAAAEHRIAALMGMEEIGRASCREREE